MLGPATYREWGISYRVFRTLCIMLGIITPAWLDRYAWKIRDYADEHPDSWGVIYQADVRARREHAPEVREQTEEEYATALAKRRPYDYDPKMPWEFIWERLPYSEKDYFAKDIERPGPRSCRTPGCRSST